MKQTLKLPLPLKVSTNKIYSGMHWTKRKKIKDNYLKVFGFYKNKLTPIEGKINHHIDFYFKTRALDSSNCSFMRKMIEDCLTHYGIIKDDTIKYVGKVSMQSHKTKEDDYCIITLEDHI